MARYTGPSCKLCRREGKKLFLKGDRCLSDKCALDRRATVPGQHGAGRKSVKEYDFKRPAKFSKEHLRTLEIIFEHYGRLVSTNLPVYLRKSCQVSVVNS